MTKLIWKLTQGEPIIDIYIQPTTGFANALKAAGHRPPDPIKVRGLVDTGFTGGLAVEQSIVKKWGLRIRNFNQVTFPRDAEGRVLKTYAWEADLAVKFIASSARGENVLVDPIPATLLEFVDDNSVQALIGQEILQALTFIYEGPRQQFSLTFSRNFEVQ